MAEQELKIKIKADVTELTKLKRDIKEAEDALLKAAKGEGQFANDVKKASDNLKQKQQALKQAKESLKEFGLEAKRTGVQLLEMYENVTVIIAGLTALTAGITNFVKSSVDSFSRQELAIAKLKNGLSSLGKEGALVKLTAQAEQLQKTTIYSDEDIINAQSFLAIQGRLPDEIEKVIRAAIELSSVTGEDLYESVRKLDATYEGNIGRLGKLDEGFKKLSDEELRNGGAVDLVLQKYTGLGDAIGNTLTGKVKRFENAWDDLKESLGEGVVNTITNQMTMFDAVMGKSEESTTSLKIAFEGFGLVVASTLGSLVLLIKGIEKYLSVIDDMRDNTVNSLAVIRDALGKKAPTTFFGSIIDVTQQAINKLIEFLGLLPDQEWEGSVGFMGRGKDGIGKGGDPEAHGAPLSKPTTGKGGTKKEVEEITTAYKELKDKITAAQKVLDLLRVEGFGETTNAIQDQLKVIAELNKQLANLSKIAFGTNKLSVSNFEINEDGQIVLRSFDQPPKDTFLKNQKIRDQEMIDDLLGKSFNSLEASFNDFADLIGASGHTFFGQVVQAGETFSSIVKLIFQVNETVGLFKSLLSFLPFGSLFGGGASMARADGGPVTAGQTYLTGEKGIELFTPSVNGYVHSNDELRALVSNAQNRSIGNAVNIINLYAENDAGFIVKKGLPKYNRSKRMTTL